MCQNGKRGLRLCLPIKGGGAKAPEGLLNKKKSAFTLAEVLITLGIIGIVAAMTLPGIIANHRKAVLKTQFDKAHSVLRQVVERMIYDAGGDLYGMYYDDNDQKGEELREAFFSYFKDTKNEDILTEIKPYYTSARNSKTSIHNCPAGCCTEPGKKAYIVVDGIMYLACARDDSINFAFDINGNNKGPNKWGVDLFDFDLGSDNKLTVSTYSCNTQNCNTYFGTTSTNNVNDGIGCTDCAVKDPDYFKKIDY